MRKVALSKTFTISRFQALLGYVGTSSPTPANYSSGLGDSLMDHRDTCMYFILILIGLAVVSMSIGVIQLKIEAIFARIIRSIDNDFRHALLGGWRRGHMDNNEKKMI